MGIKLSKLKRAARHYFSMKAARKKVGLTGGSRHFRQLKRSIGNISGRGLSYQQPVSASSYQHSPRTLSQLTGGV